MTTTVTCPQCHTRFMPWRAKRYCSVSCRKQAENARMRESGRPEATHVAKSQNPTNKPQQLQASPRAMREYEPLLWIVVNDVTRKAVQKGNPSPLAWVIKASAYGWQEAEGWFGRIGCTFSFGPTTEARAKAAVEAQLRGKPSPEPQPEAGPERLRKSSLGRLFRWYTRPPRNASGDA